MMPYDYNYYGETATNLGANTVWIIISIVVAIIGGITLYFTFLSKENENKYEGFLGYLYEFLTFKKIMIEPLIRILYLIFAIGLTLLSFTVIGENFLEFLLVLIGGNIALRIVYELIILTLELFSNIRSINNKMKEKK